MEPHGGCTPNPPCGFIGTCDGNGACRNGPDHHQLRHRLVQRVDVHAGRALRRRRRVRADGDELRARSPAAPAACLTTCAGDGDCTAGFTCRSSSCTNLKANGAACVAGDRVLQRQLRRGRLLRVRELPQLLLVRGRRQAGTCQPVPGGRADPAGDCLAMAASTCGTTGPCDGAGQCATYPAGTPCGADDLHGGGDRC